LAAALKEEFGVDAELVVGGGGIFDVEVDGTVVFAKAEVGRFPEEGEVEAKVRELT
jgi:predicted Rdx family selenoprotein